MVKIVNFMLYIFYHNKKIGKKDMFTLTTFIQHFIRGSRQCSQARERKESYPNWKRRSETIFVGNMIVYTEV